MGVSDHLAPLLALLRAAYPRGVPAEDYMPLLVVLQTDMSERNLAEVVGALIGRDPVVVANDAAAAASRQKPPSEEVLRVRRILEEVGWRPELQSPAGLCHESETALAQYLSKAWRASLVEVRLPANQVSRPVQHRTVEEIWYVLEGEGTVWRCPPDSRAGETVTVRPGDTLTIPHGWRFQFRAGSGPLRFLCYTSPPWPGPEEAVLAPPGGLGPPTV